jgi:hypothetical protein
MAITNKKFKFVSPGILLNEIDNSQLPAVSQPDGPVIIGRTERGPSMTPVEVSSFSEFVEVFGSPVAGNSGGDVWRDGNNTSPTYASYAAEAWLKNSNKATIIRVVGDQHTTPTDDGRAGWKLASFDSSGGGAYGLFVFQSGSAVTNVTGTLAAVFYCGTTTAFELSGSQRHTGTAITGTGVLIGNTSGQSGLEFTGQIVNGTTVSNKTSFNFDRSSDRYIRKVFNTNPILTNGDVITSTQPYWLGETYEENLVSLFGSSPATPFYACVMALSSGDIDAANFRKGSVKATTGWVFSQDLTTNFGSYSPDSMQKLFRFEDLDSGESNQKRFKVSLQDIKPSQNPTVQPFGTFTVVIREAGDSDSAPRILESFTGCDLNPSSPNYVSAKIGDKTKTWDDVERRYITQGSFENNSKFIRVVMNSDVDTGVADPACLPFGYFGPKRFKSYTVISGSTSVFEYGSTTTSQSAYIGKTQGVKDTQASGSYLNVGTQAFTGSIVFPKFALRASSTNGSLTNNKNAYFGTLYNRQSDYITVDKGFTDLVRTLPVGLDHLTDNALLENSFVFTLDDISGSGVVTSATSVSWSSGSRVAGTSYTALSGASALLNSGWNRFTLPLFGGFDGFDVTESEPFRNSGLTSATETTNYAFYSLSKAIGIAADPMVNMNVVTIPGVTNTGIKNQLIQLCEERGDAIAILDPVGGFTPRAEGTAVSYGSVTNVDTVVTNTKEQAYNTSYAAMYYPWVKSVDGRTGQQVWLPPSIPALGVFSNTDRRADPWFAPAGFTRGGLSSGAGGVSVVGVAQELTAKERDKLYEININPIAQFPAEGIVVYGQKTLQFSRSALDRINVRRLMLYVKKEVSRIAATTLFNPNTLVTWNDFKSRVTILLDSVKSRYGLEEFKVVLDETTTTPDLVDQNIMYAKILLKPTKTTEFIAVDFVITNSGASFED